MAKKDFKEEDDYEEEYDRQGFSLTVDGLPGFSVQNLSRSNYFDGKRTKFPQVKDFWEAEEDDELQAG